MIKLRREHNDARNGEQIFMAGVGQGPPKNALRVLSITCIPGAHNYDFRERHFL